MRFLVPVAASVAVALFPVLAPAQAVIPVGTTMATSVVPVPTAPIVLTSCKMEKGGAYMDRWTGNLVLANRTKHAMSAARVVLTAYDGERTRMDQRTVDVRVADPVLAGESASSPIDVEFAVSENRLALIARVTCRVQSAVFSGNKKWDYGKSWPEKLVPLHTEPTADAGGARGLPLSITAPTSRALESQLR